MFATTLHRSPSMNLIVKKQILIIDDEEAVTTVVQSCFEDIAGWDVLTAASGREGLLIAQDASPDAIVLDVMMPDMDGLTVLRNLKSSVITRSIPVILLTAKTSLTESPQVNKLGVTGAIAKPFDPFLLVDQVADLLGWIVDL
jgi:CheY-like chemotaxis protein